MLFYINGQGPREDFLADADYARYLSECWQLMEDKSFLRRACGQAYEDAMRADDHPAMDFLLLRAPYGRTVYLGGDRNSGPIVGGDEIDSMTAWFSKNGAVDIRFRSVEGHNLQERLRLLSHQVGSEKMVVVFCAYAEQDLTRFLVGRLFTCPVVVPVSFSGGLVASAKERAQQAVRLPRQILSWYASRLISFKIG